MKINFHLPDIHSLYTGGNIYNRKMIENLTGLGIAEIQLFRHPADSREFLNRAERFGTFDLHLVDSLLLKNAQFMSWLEQSSARVRKILLIHYLHFLEPGNSEKVGSEDERKSLNIFNRFITTSAYSARRMIESGFPGKNIRVVKPGIQKEKIFLGKKKKEKHIPRIITASSIFPGKGLIEFLDVLSGLTDIEWEWHLAGEDRLHPEFTEKFLDALQQVSFRDRVTYHGSLTQSSLYQLMENSDIFVLPSSFETLSMVSMEAISHGLPVVAYRVGGLPEVVYHDRNGFLCPAEDKLTFSFRIRTLLNDENLRSKMSHNSLKLRESFHTWEDAARLLEKALEDLH